MVNDLTARSLMAEVRAVYKIILYTVYAELSRKKITHVTVNYKLVIEMLLAATLMHEPAIALLCPLDRYLTLIS